MADIDHFKRVNDQSGHPFGDRVLRRFADSLRQESREVDLVARIGGEEFAVVVPEVDLEHAGLFAERLRLATAQIQIESIGVRASFGVSSSTHSDYSGSKLIQDADAALYRAKQGGRDRVELGEGTAIPLPPDADPIAL